VAITDKYRLEDGVAGSLDFADFVRQRSAPMLRTAWLLTGGDWALAEDLAQAAFSQVWRHWTRVAVMEAPEAYTHKAMLNTFLSWRRRRWTAEISTDRFVVSPATTGGFATVDSREVLRHALRQLTTKQRAVITLRYFEDRSEAETAVIMGCSVGTVKSQASKAIAKLREHPGLADVMMGGMQR
jgi:RNA polymerase sigma-70 factor (sigma-E family)